MQKICPHCKQEFSPKRKDQLYCSKKCRDLAYKKRKYRKEHLQVKICPVCNKEFETVYKKRIYCSGKCRRDANKAKYLKKHRDEYLEYLKEWRDTHKGYLKQYRSEWAKREDVKFTKKFCFYYIQEVTRAKSVAEHKYYTEYTANEDEFLLQNWDKITKKEIALHLGRTLASVHSRYKKLKKLSKNL